MPSLCLCPPPHRAQIWESRSDKLTSKQKAGQQGSPSDSFYPRGDGGPLQPSGDCGVSHCKRTKSTSSSSSCSGAEGGGKRTTPAVQFTAFLWKFQALQFSHAATPSQAPRCTQPICCPGSARKPAHLNKYHLQPYRFWAVLSCTRGKEAGRGSLTPAHRRQSNSSEKPV
ncbi:uncharacterized protein LOC144006415 isoform X2 [Festucalex cinctus]